MPSWDSDRLVTFSRSVTLDLTYRCLARCGYCEYRSDEGGLISPAEIERLLNLGQAKHCRAALVISGERPCLLPRVSQALALSFPSRAPASGRLERGSADDAFS